MGARFVAGNPEFEADVRRSFSRQTLMNTLGASLELVAPGEVHVGIHRSAALCQQNGFLHAGVITSIADTACGYAALTLAPAGMDVLAVEFKINLLSPARAERFVARARVLRPGRTLTVSLAEVAGISDSGEDLVATMLSTVITRPAAGAKRD
ncbi:MAG TPA: PaaI family thioesterase [Patescibacteria group bacterium]|nr:PaaI family thioesterase [Patescibacteria group bacterium]